MQTEQIHVLNHNERKGEDWARKEFLKRHFGLHNPLMTLNSLEIRNSLCLIPVLQVGACGGVTE